jgi:hypothetical protein
MTVLRANDKDTVSLAKGTRLTVTASAAGRGRINRLPLSAGGSHGGYENIVASEVKFYGPYAETRQFLIEAFESTITIAESQVGLAGDPSRKLISGVAHTLTNDDSGLILRTTNADPVDITVNSGLSISSIKIEQFGDGQVTFVEGSGVHIRSPETLSIAKKYASAVLEPTLDSVDEYLLSGYLEAAT